ncbi:CoA pyrophosphatase [Bacillus sp. N1-1]|jgi:peroxisomal coenzyme A diphosphatase NUDT7|uniref:NUDIX hydrolase n=1 Tax=Bacillus sp. N1-1 TaxID=2682541 RepID=UPI0013192012|nr:CoA pyrophosphatase [Bacillus sp. N1-1]QHA90580.1 NUDIX domain-containing protein [Bacillus sp. N1-1]
MKPSLVDIHARVNGRSAGVLGNERFYKFAVFLPLIERQGELHVLFEVRAHTLRRQPGEVCFPGGKVDRHDQNPKNAAIRETCEELGILEREVSVMGELDFLVTSFQSIVYPFAGIINVATELSPNPDEVEEVFTVPLSHFIDNPPERHDIRVHVKPDDSFPFHLIPNGEEYNWSSSSMPEFFYYYQDYVIWGMTARILYHFIQLLDEK